MGDITKNNDETVESKGLENLINLKTAEILRDYLLGYKKNGKPRAVYDVFKDQLSGGKKKGKGKKRSADKFSLYIEPGKRKKSKKKGKKKKKSHWEY